MLRPSAGGVADVVAAAIEEEDPAGLGADAEEDGAAGGVTAAGCTSAGPTGGKRAASGTIASTKRNGRPLPRCSSLG